MEIKYFRSQCICNSSLNNYFNPDILSFGTKVYFGIINTLVRPSLFIPQQASLPEL